jgi:hypothetical protein
MQTTRVFGFHRFPVLHSFLVRFCLIFPFCPAPEARNDHFAKKNQSENSPESVNGQN